MNKIDFKSMMIGALLFCLGLTTMNFKPNSEHITCKSISIINNDGEEIAYLGQSTKDSGILYLNNERGKEVAYLGSNEWGGGLVSVNNYMNKRVAYLGEDSSGSGLLALFNKFGSKVMGAGADAQDFTGLIDVNNDRGDLRGRVTVVDDQGIIITVDSKGEVSGSIPR